MAATAALIGGLALVACGGDSESDGSGEDGVIAEADAICTEANEQDVPQITNFDSDPVRAAEILEQKLAVANEEHDDVAALDPPAEVSEQWQQFVDRDAERLALGEEQKQAIEERDVEAIQTTSEQAREIATEQTELAEEIGFEVCGFGRYVVADPEPAVSLEQRLTVLADAVRDEDCAALMEIVGTELLVPEDQQQGFCESLYADFEGFDPEQAQVDDWGTAAVIENEGENGRVIAQPLLLDGDETFRIASVFQGQPAVGTEPEPDAEFEEVAERTVAAVRDEDCDAIAELYDPDTFPSPEDACEAFSFRLGSVLQQDPELTPELLGANAWFAAFALRSEQGSYTTMLVSRKDGDDRSAEQGGDYRVSALAAPFR